MSNIKKIFNKYNSIPVQVRASFWFLVCSFLQQGVAMITTPIFTRIMSTSDYGKYGVFTSWYGIVFIIVTLSLAGGVYTQGLIKFDGDRKIFTSSLQGLTAILVLVWLLIYIFIHNTINNLLSLETIQMLSMFLIMWSTAVFNFWANEKRVEYSYRKLVIVTLIVSVVRPLLEIMAVMHAEDKATARIVTWAITCTLAYFWMFIEHLYRGKQPYSRYYWKYALSFNIPLIPHYLSQIVLNSADRIMIQRIIGESEAGIYNLAYSLSLIMTLFNSALMQTITPWMYQKIKEKKHKDIAPIAYSTLVLIAFFNILLILIAPEAVRIFAPKEYYEAIWVIPPVAMSVLFMYCYDLFATYAFYYEKTKAIMIASVIGAILNIALNAIFIRLFGYIAAGYTTLFCFIVYSLAHYIYMKKVCNECCEGENPYDTRIILLICVGFLIAGLMISTTYNYPMIRYALLGLMITICILNRKSIYKIIVSLRRTRKA